MVIWVLLLKAEGWDQSLEDCLQLQRAISQCNQTLSELPAVIREKQTIAHSKTLICAEKEHGISRQEIHHMKNECTLMLRLF